jgi:hypothetical protein
VHARPGTEPEPEPITRAWADRMRAQFAEIVRICLENPGMDAPVVGDSAEIGAMAILAMEYADSGGIVEFDCESRPGVIYLWIGGESNVTELYPESEAG